MKTINLEMLPVRLRIAQKDIKNTDFRSQSTLLRNLYENSMESDFSSFNENEYELTDEDNIKD